MQTQIPREEKPLDTLIGKQIKEVYINKDNNIIKFLCCDDVEYLYFAEADCCSESWFEGFNGLKALRYKDRRFSAEVLSVDYIKCNCDIPNTKQEVDEITHFKISFGRYSDITFNLRNSSNGYYGGSVSYCGNKIQSWMSDGKETFRFAQDKQI